MRFIVFGSILLNEKGKHMFLEVIRTCPLSQTNLYAAGATGKTSWLKYLFSPRGTILPETNIFAPENRRFEILHRLQRAYPFSQGRGYSFSFFAGWAMSNLCTQVYSYTCFLQTHRWKFMSLVTGYLGFRFLFFVYMLRCCYLPSRMQMVQAFQSQPDDGM